MLPWLIGGAVAIGAAVIAAVSDDDTSSSSSEDIDRKNKQARDKAIRKQKNKQK